MATGNITRNIGTTFTVSGLQNAMTGFRNLAQNFRTRMIAMRDAAARAFAPILAGLRNIAAFSFKKLQFAASLAFKGIAAAAALASLRIKSIAAAAVEASKGMGELLDKISKDSRRLGMRPEDTMVLRYGFERQGVDADEVLSTLSDIGNEFKSIQQQINLADAAYQKTKDWNFQKVLANRTQQSVFDAMNSNAEAAPNSFWGIRDQKEFIRQRLLATKPSEDQTRLQLVELWKQLDAQETQMKQGMGEQAKALFNLEGYGLDFNRAIKGGIDGLTALSDAFRQVQDPQEQLRISMQLFGEDMGARMVTVLQSGREGIEEYRKDLERLGSVVTANDAKLGSDYIQNLQRLKLAFFGVKLELARGMLPLLQDSQAQLTEWLVTNRTWIVQTMKAAFIQTRDLWLDIVDLFRGNTSGFRNSWLDAAAPALVFLVTWLGKIQTQVGKIFSGEDSDWTWLNVARDGLIGLYKLVKDVWTVAFGGKAASFPWVDTIVAQIKWLYAAILDMPDQVKKVWNGMDSDWGWLNSIRDGLLYVRDLAVDVWNVLTGGDASRFEFLNRWRDQVVDFAGRVKDAFSIVKDAFELVHSGVQSIVGLVGGDATTLALVGIFTKIALSITGIATAAKLARTAIGWLLGVGGGGAAATAATAGTATAGAVTAAGAAATGGLAASLTRIGTLVLGLIRNFGVLGTVVTGVIVAGKYALDYSAQSGDAVIQKQLELMRFQADRQVQAREDWKIMHPAPKAPEVTSFLGQQILTRDQLSALAENQGTSNEAYAARRAGIINDYARNNVAQTERIQLDLNLGGQSIQATVDRKNADLVKQLDQVFRTY